jgi:mRNA interferase RelE/StbE
MKYAVDLKPKAARDLKRMQKADATRVVEALERLQDDLAGNVKRLANFTPEYRLRVGHFRALFEIEDGARIVVYRVVHRREAYR